MNQLFLLLGLWIIDVPNWKIVNTLEYSSISIIFIYNRFSFFHQFHQFHWFGSAQHQVNSMRTQWGVRISIVYMLMLHTYRLALLTLWISISRHLFFRCYLISTIFGWVFFLLSYAVSYSPCFIWISSHCARISMAHSPYIAFRLKWFFSPFFSFVLFLLNIE